MKLLAWLLLFSICGTAFIKLALTVFTCLWLLEAAVESERRR